MKNKFYLLERNPQTVRWDEYDAQIVCASSPQEARELCVVGDEGSLPWLDSKLTTCKVIKPTKMAGMILASFRAG